jgi:hypothetical protein
VNTSRVIILFIPVGNLADITEQTLLDRFTKRSFFETKRIQMSIKRYFQNCVDFGVYKREVFETMFSDIRSYTAIYRI